MDWQLIKEKELLYGIGITAGNSVVGIDGALVRFRTSGSQVAIKLIHYQHFPYDPATRNRLLMSYKDTKTIGLLHFELGALFARAAQDLLKISSISIEEFSPDFLAIKGFSVVHIPRRGTNPVVGSLEIGTPAMAVSELNIPVISNFYEKDIAVGGQGAPIFPYADHVLFSRKDRTTMILHLGAYASITILPPEREQVISFEVGPCNIAIDGAIRLLTSGNREFDANGKAAFSGVVIDEFLDYLLDHPYFQRVPPKSVSREEFSPEVYLRDALAGRRDKSLEDLLATVTVAVGTSIVRAYQRFVKDHYPVARIILTGGGVKNAALVGFLQKALGKDLFRTSESYGLPAMGVDPIRTAILGHAAMLNLPSNIPAATGASRSVVLGRFTFPG